MVMAGETSPASLSTSGRGGIGVVDEPKKACCCQHPNLRSEMLGTPQWRGYMVVGLLYDSSVPQNPKTKEFPKCNGLL